MLAKSRTINLGILAVLLLIVFAIYGYIKHNQHAALSHELVDTIQNVNLTLLTLDKLQQHILHNRERVSTSGKFNNVQNYQFYSRYHEQYKVLHADLITKALPQVLSDTQRNRLMSYHDTFIMQQEKIISSFEFTDLFQDKIDPTLNLHGLISIEFIEFLHQLKRYITENAYTFTQTQSTHLLASELLIQWLFIGLGSLLLCALFITLYFFYLNSCLLQHIKGMYSQSTRPILTINKHGMITQFNQQFEQLTAKPTLRKHQSHIKDIIGNHWVDLAILLDPFISTGYDLKDIIRSLAQPSEPTLCNSISYKLSMNTAQGSKPMAIDITVIQSYSKFRAMLIFKDQSEQEAMQAQINTDNFTKIANKSNILHRLSEEIERAKRHQLLLSIIFIDIDEFKQINDKHGHQFGDKVIKWVAARIKKRVRDTDFLGRYGGDEFLIVCPDCNDTQALFIAQDIRSLLNNPKLHVKASVGVAQMQANDTQQTLLERADKAMYQAKNQGKNKVVVYKQRSQL